MKNLLTPGGKIVESLCFKIAPSPATVKLYQPAAQVVLEL
jgi:hypothetical protein